MARKRTRRVTDIGIGTDLNEFEQASFARLPQRFGISSRIGIGSKEIEQGQLEILVWVANIQ